MCLSKIQSLNKSYSSGIVKDGENIYENQCAGNRTPSPFTVTWKTMRGSGPND